VPPLQYDLLAIDLDGTLLNPQGRVSPANVAAVHAARNAGLHVTICTGRSLRECREILSAIGQTEPVIVSGGAMRSCPVTGHTLDRSALEPSLTADLVSFLSSAGHTPLVLKDPHAAGFDYLAVAPGGRGEAAIDAASRWWFAKMGVSVRYVEHIGHDEHPEHSIRVGAYAANRPVDALAHSVSAHFGPRVTLQHFEGVVMGDDRLETGIMSVHIVEVFDPAACKWQAIERLAAHMGIPNARIAAIGDQGNDLSMIRNAACGIAMGNATPAVKAAAKHQTRTSEEAGVAWAVEQLLAGRW
jgi:hypothetical protein